MSRQLYIILKRVLKCILKYIKLLWSKDFLCILSVFVGWYLVFIILALLGG